MTDTEDRTATKGGAAGRAAADAAPELDPQAARAALRRCRRIIVKIGSKSLSGDAWDRLAAEVAALRGRSGRSLVIVSSGAIALGVAKLGLKSRPKDMAWLQAAAAAGQSVLMQRYEEAFGKVGLLVAQVLLTHADLADRTRTNNARNALAALLEAGAIPIINENDAVAVEEIKFGDNDQLAAMVTPLCEADLLILLSDVEGLLDGDGRRVPFVRSVAREARHLAGASTSGVGTGGMASKVEAARRATLAGSHVVIGAAREAGIITRIVSGEDVGTLFAAVPQRLSARKHWIAYTLRPRGAILVDRGAAEAIGSKNRSILAVGVLGVRGTFLPGDAVAVVDPDGTEIARGLARMSASDAARTARKKREEAGDDDVVVHRDDLVVLPSE
ncbi:proB [Sorangium cellulosum So ce56]|uniref:Glutamate 5-kinase n=1 Tax=Sorangium cellulosum (strain So ce56) TaxID=448385 RepID=A9FT85_SORC5|nr:glutamate 5-kinase [Sorangium cellulosum]CAN98503.1 proB [Sorangium cellulosum So ce56]